MPEKRTYSISFRLRRTTYEEAFVSVPVTDDLWQDTPDEQGRVHLDGKKAMEAALHLGADPEICWRLEGTRLVELHPIQVAPNEGSGDSSKIH